MPMQAESLEVLEKANLPSAQARAIVRAIEIELVGARDWLATRQDLILWRQDLRQEIAHLGTQLRKEIGDLRAEVHRSISGLARSFYLAILGQTAVMLGFGYFLVAQLR